MDTEIEDLRNKLTGLKTEHQDLDAAIESLAAGKPYAQIEMQRLKKRKLLLKDQIVAIEDKLLPDIIA